MARTTVGGREKGVEVTVCTGVSKAIKPKRAMVLPLNSNTNKNLHSIKTS